MRVGTIESPARLTSRMAPREPISIADSAAETSATLAPWRGALVTSFKVRGQEVLYLDQETFEDPQKNVRGGIPAARCLEWATCLPILPAVTQWHCGRLAFDW